MICSSDLAESIDTSFYHQAKATAMYTVYESVFKDQLPSSKGTTLLARQILSIACLRHSMLQRCQLKLKIESSISRKRAAMGRY